MVAVQIDLKNIYLLWTDLDVFQSAMDLRTECTLSKIDSLRFSLVTQAYYSGQLCSDFVAYCLVNLGAIQLVTSRLPNVAKPTHLPRISCQYWPTQLLAFAIL